MEDFTRKEGEPELSSPRVIEAISLSKTLSVGTSLPTETQNLEEKFIPAPAGDHHTSPGSTEIGVASEQQIQIEEHWLELTDGRMRYLKAGSGPAIILIHGLMGYSFSWRFAIPALAPHATVYAIDNLGAGLSTARDDMDCTVRATAERILQFADVLGIKDFDLLGTSHGGGVAIMVGAVCTERREAEKECRVQRVV